MQYAVGGSPMMHFSRSQPVAPAPVVPGNHGLVGPQTMPWGSYSTMPQWAGTGGTASPHGVNGGLLWGSAGVPGFGLNHSFQGKFETGGQAAAFGQTKPAANFEFSSTSDASPTYNPSHAHRQEDAPGDPPEQPGIVGNCILCLPEATLRILGLKPNIDDKGALKKRLWLGRSWQLRALALKKYRQHVLEKQKPLTYAERCRIDREISSDVTKLDLIRHCQKVWRGAILRRRSSLASVLGVLDFHMSPYQGAVLFMHGSGGMTYNNVRYARKLASMGYIVIAPDSMAGGQYRHRDVAGIINSEANTPYWDDLGLYTSNTAGEYSYNTKADDVVHDPGKYKKLYENVFRLRSLEMHWILRRLPMQMKVKGVFTMGQSEGAMTVARFDDRRYGAMIRGRIISAFSVEYCYFTPTREAGMYGGSPEVATLNIIGDADQYFGNIDSVAKSVNAQKGHGGWGSEHLTGNGFKQMKRQGIRRGLVAVLEGAKHDASETHDNFLRDLLRQFLASPHECHRIAEQWAPDGYLSSKIETLEFDDHGGGARLLIKAKKWDYDPKMEYGQELGRRQVFTVRQQANKTRQEQELVKRVGQRQRHVHFDAQTPTVTRHSSGKSGTISFGSTGAGHFSTNNVKSACLAGGQGINGGVACGSLNGYRNQSPPRTLMSTRSAAQTKVQLTKLGGTFGFRVDHASPNVLRITWIDPHGALGSWSNRNAGMAVREGDQIVAVNSANQNSGDLFAELVRSNYAELLVEKYSGHIQEGVYHHF